MTKNCKLCSKPRYANTSFCKTCYFQREKQKKQEKAELKKLRKESTKKFQEEIAKKLIKTNDRLFQELGRLIFKSCYFGHTYCCIHHFVRKSQSLFLRYSLKNAMPVCKECHCSIHLGENSILEAKFVMDKGEEWLKEIEAYKLVTVNDKLKFLKEKNIEIKEVINKFKINL